MIELSRFGLGLVADLVRGRAALLAENAMLRQQLIAAQRKIHGRVRWEHLGRPRSASLKAKQIRQLAGEGVSNSEIARRLGIGRTSVRRVLQNDAA